MAPTVRSSAVIGENQGNTSCAVAKPTGLTVGDYIIALHFGDADNTLASMTGPSGFSADYSVTPDSGNNVPACKVWTKVATSTETAASTFTFNDAGSADAGVVMLAITVGTFDTGTPVTWGTTTTITRPPGSATQTAPSMTGVNGGLLLAMFITDTNGTVESFPASGPSGMTLVDQVQDNGNHYALGGVYSEALSSGDATGTRAVSPTGGTSSNGCASFLAVVNPLPGANVATLSGGFLSILGL